MSRLPRFVQVLIVLAALWLLGFALAFLVGTARGAARTGTFHATTWAVSSATGQKLFGCNVHTKGRAGGGQVFVWGGLHHRCWTNSLGEVTGWHDAGLANQAHWFAPWHGSPIGKFQAEFTERFQRCTPIPTGDACTATSYLTTRLTIWGNGRFDASKQWVRPRLAPAEEALS